MKNKIQNTSTKIGLLVFTLFATASAFAQDGLDIDVDLVDDSPALLDNPLFWVGVAVFIIILALIFMNARKKS